MSDRPLKRTSRIALREQKTLIDRFRLLKSLGIVDFQPGSQATEDAADASIENAVGTFPMPLGVATNFIVNGVERLIAMATEERSVIAAASYAAKLCREKGGFSVEVGPNVARGQIL